MVTLIGGIAYINLEFRGDRKKHIELELKKLESITTNVHRIDAVLEPYCGHLGCGKSHIKAVELAIEKDWDSVLIVEDDMKFTEPATTLVPRIQEVFDISWDVLLLGYGHKHIIPSTYSFLDKVITSTCAHAYIVRKHYYQTLLKNFQTSVWAMTNELREHMNKCKIENTPITKLHYCSAIDQGWFSLQGKDTFYVCNPQLGIQGDQTYSDNNCSIETQKNRLECIAKLNNNLFSMEHKLSELDTDITTKLDTVNYRIATYDNLSYYINDNSFEWHINNGLSKPYGNNKDLDIVIRYLRDHPDRNRTYIDIGSHVGTTILPYSRLFKHAYGYEPHYENFFLAQNNISLNNITNCIIKNCAVSDKNTTGKSIKCGTNSGCYVFMEDLSSNTRSLRIDDEGIEDVDFIKISIQGGEFYALKGAIHTINTFKPLLQIDTHHLSDIYFDVTSREVNTFISSLGYTSIGNNFYKFTS